MNQSIQSAVDLLFLIMMIDNPLPDQVMQEKQRDFENGLFKDHCYKLAQEICEEHSVFKELIESFQEWYHTYCSVILCFTDPFDLDVSDKQNLLNDWWQQQGEHLARDHWREKK